MVGPFSRVGSSRLIRVVILEALLLLLSSLDGHVRRARYIPHELVETPARARSCVRCAPQ